MDKLSCDIRISEEIVLGWSLSLVRVLGLAVFLAGIWILYAWDFGSGLLTGPFRLLPPTNPLSAVGIILCGLAVFFSTFRYTRKIAAVISILIIFIGTAKVLDVLGIQIPIDQMFFYNKLSQFNPPSRMAPLTAVNLILSGLCLLFLNAKIKARELTPYFAMFIIGTSLLLSIGYLFGTTFFPELRAIAFNQFIFLSPLAPLTAYSFVIIGMAVLLISPRKGIVELIVTVSATGPLIRRLALAALIIPVFVGYIGVFSIMIFHLETQLGAAIAVFLGIVLLEAIIFRNTRELTDVWNERCRIEEEIAQTNAFNEALLSSIGDGVVAVDRNGFILFFNHAAENIFNTKIEDTVGRRYSDVWSISDKTGKPLPISKMPIQMSLETGKRIISTLADHYSYTSNNKTIPINITTSPIFLNNRLIGVVGIFRDISYEVQVDKAKNELISLASHQLRTPVTAISWMVETFFKKYGKKLNTDQFHSLEEIYQANDLVKDLIDDFLNISRAELGTIQISPKPVNIQALLREIISSELKVQITEKKTKITEKYGKNLIINSDYNLLRIIIINLVSNAVKFTSPKGKINISTEEIKAGKISGGKKIQKDGYLIVVSDNGYGIPEQERKQIFTKLFRASNVRKKGIEGTGLGLYMVKLFIDKLGGEVWFKSEENKGSEFFVFLPKISNKKANIKG